MMFPFGRYVKGELHSTDATTAAQITVYGVDLRTETIGSGDRLLFTDGYVTGVGVVAVTPPDLRVFYDLVAFTARTLVSFVDGGGGEDSLTLTGDFLAEFANGRAITIAGTTSNDANYTSTGSTVTAGVTTVTVATGSWTDTDIGSPAGTVVGTRSIVDGAMALRTTPSAHGGIAMKFSETEMAGPLGWALFLQSSAVGITDVLFTGRIVGT